MPNNNKKSNKNNMYNKTLSKMNSDFVKITNNKYVLYVMLFLGITTVLGFLSVQDYNALILFIVVAFAVNYFTKNMTIVLLTAVVASNIITIKSNIEGMGNPDDGTTREEEDDDGDDGKPDEGGDEYQRPSVSNGDDDDEDGDEYGVGSGVASGPDRGAGKPHYNSSKKDRLKRRVKNREGMAPIDYKMSIENIQEDDDDAAVNEIDRESTQQMAFANLNKMIGSKGFKKMTSDTQTLIEQQNKLADTMESIGPMLGNAEKMLGKLNLDKVTSMLDKFTGAMGGGAKNKQT